MCCGKAWSSFQLFLLRHPNCLSRGLLYLCYCIDVIWFGQRVAAERSFFKETSTKVGSLNFGALGRLCVGKYTDVQALLQEPQQRGPYLGPTLLNASKLPPDFLITLSDHQGPQASRHETLHKYFFQDLLLPAQDRIVQHKAVFQQYVQDFMTSYRKAGSPRKKQDIEPLAAKLAIQYVMHALFDLVLTPPQIETLRSLFYTGGARQSYLLSAVLPASTCVCGTGPRTRAIAEMCDLLETSSVLQDYTPSPDTLNLSKREFCEFLLAMAGTAGILGTGSLAINICALFPRDRVTTTTTSITNESLFTHVLELARLHPPVSEFNCILHQERTLEIGRKPTTFPHGTPVCVVLLLASYDGSVFANPDTFDPTRANLMTKTVNFNSVGFDDAEVGRRTCPGRNVAMTMNVNVLKALLETEARAQQKK